MAFRNLTPLPCLPFAALTPGGERVAVVILRATLDLVPADPGPGGFSHVLRLSRDQKPLAFTDLPNPGPPGASLRWESDTAPVKPRCDVLLLGEAHAPQGRPCRRFRAGLVLRGPGAGEPLLEKWVLVTGERSLLRRGLLARTCGALLRLGTLGRVRPCPWTLTRPGPIQALPLIHEHAFGGHCKVLASDPTARRVPRRAARAEALRAWREEGTDGLLAEAYWPANPAGCGFVPVWLPAASRQERWPAPQLEDPAAPFTARRAWEAALGRGAGPGGEPQGFNPVGRGWASRLALAGTWNDAWAAGGAPYPADFDPAFHNCAPPSLQCPWLEGGEILELTNLCPPSLPGAQPGADGGTVLRFQVPTLGPCLVREPGNGPPERHAARLDTVVLEPGAGRVTLLYRASHPWDPVLGKVELRLGPPA